jgi:hypothetical protein
MFHDLSNRTVIALLCVSIIVLSCLVIEGLYYPIETHAASLRDQLLKRVGWKPLWWIENAKSGRGPAFYAVGYLDLNIFWIYDRWLHSRALRCRDAVLFGSTGQRNSRLRGPLARFATFGVERLMT